MTSTAAHALYGASSGSSLDADSPGLLEARFRKVRARTAALAAPLSAEDAMVQSMDDTSPAKWHLAHTTWFFEHFVLGRDPHYQPINPDWHFLFNSYYQSVGPMHARPRRGLLSRPGLEEVRLYREEVDACIARAFAAGDIDEEGQQAVLLGTHHEQQHQELLLTDIKHAFWCNPLRPAYRGDLAVAPRDTAAVPMAWQRFDERIAELGHAPWPDNPGFAYDNESPPHRVLVPAHSLASRPVSNADYRAFIDDGGYRNVSLWMSEGWARVQAGGWTRPLYWEADLEHEFTLGGTRVIAPHAPVCHLSYFEADAFARWAGARLPTESEWESAARHLPLRGHFADDDRFHPMAAPAERPQMFGDVWEWTSTAYGPHPGFRPLPGSLGEYNGKFMCGQWILRGGSCATPRDHIRHSYRNFFYPPDRWQFSGLRLAKDDR